MDLQISSKVHNLKLPMCGTYCITFVIINEPILIHYDELKSTLSLFMCPWLLVKVVFYVPQSSPGPHITLNTLSPWAPLLGSDNSSGFSLFLMTLRASGLVGRYFVGHLSPAICLLFFLVSRWGMWVLGRKAEVKCHSHPIASRAHTTYKTGHC